MLSTPPNIGKHIRGSTKNPKAALATFFAHSHYRKIFEDLNKYNVSILLGGTWHFDSPLVLEAVVFKAPSCTKILK